MPSLAARCASLGSARRAGEAGEIAFDVGQNTGTPARENPSAEHLQGDRLAGAGRARDQAVAVGERRAVDGLVALADQDFTFHAELDLHMISLSTAGLAHAQFGASS